jgi:hypothetical protein
MAHTPSYERKWRYSTPFAASASMDTDTPTDSDMDTDMVMDTFEDSNVDLGDEPLIVFKTTFCFLVFKFDTNFSSEVLQICSTDCATKR